MGSWSSPRPGLDRACGSQHRSASETPISDQVPVNAQGRSNRPQNATEINCCFLYLTKLAFSNSVGVESYFAHTHKGSSQQTGQAETYTRREVKTAGWGKPKSLNLNCRHVSSFKSVEISVIALVKVPLSNQHWENSPRLNAGKHVGLH